MARRYQGGRCGRYGRKGLHSNSEANSEAQHRGIPHVRRGTGAPAHGMSGNCATSALRHCHQARAREISARMSKTEGIYPRSGCADSDDAGHRAISYGMPGRLER